jgi:anti-anti-sigma factor
MVAPCTLAAAQRGNCLDKMEFKLTEITQAACRLLLSGRMDSAGAHPLQQDLSAAMLGVDRHVVVDLSAVSFMGSLGIRLLITTARSLQRRALRMVIYGMRPAVHEVLETVSLGELIPMAATEAEALSLLSP